MGECVLFLVCATWRASDLAKLSVLRKLFFSLGRGRDQGVGLTKSSQAGCGCCRNPRSQPPLPPTTLLIIFEFLVSSLGVQPVLWESLADSSASGKQNLSRFGSEVLHHMESLTLLRLIGKAALGMHPHVTDGMAFGGWLYSPE